MKYFITFLFTAVVISSFSQTKSGQKSPPLAESSAIYQGMSSERLARIDMMLKNAIAEKEIPGAVALIARNGKIVYYKAFGMSDDETYRQLKKDDIFRIASQTKAITSTAVMMLWEEGKFRLDDPISKYIPEFENAQVIYSFSEKDSSYTTKDADRQITIRHLLTHTSGIGYGVIDADDRIKKIYDKSGIIDLFTIENVTIEDNIKKLAVLPLHHNPGEKFTYSEGLDVLGYFIEVMSGMPLDRFFRERILDPLWMYDTWFYLPASKQGRLVSVQTKQDDKWIKFKSHPKYDPDYPIKGARAYFSGGAGLTSTAKDYATFLQMYLNMGELNGIRLLSRTTVQFMMANQIGNHWDEKGTFVGLAFGVVNQKGQDNGGRGSAGTFEWGGYFNTMYFADPKEKIIGILMKQTYDIPSDETSWKFRQLVMQAVDD